MSPSWTRPAPTLPLDLRFPEAGLDTLTDGVANSQIRLNYRNELCFHSTLNLASTAHTTPYWKIIFYSPLINNHCSLGGYLLKKEWVSKWMDSKVEHFSISIVVAFDIIFPSGTHFLNKLKEDTYFPHCNWKNWPREIGRDAFQWMVTALSEHRIIIWRIWHLHTFFTCS